MLLKITPPKTVDFHINDLTLQMIEIPGGSFRMGDKDDGPIHEVTLSLYLIGKYPVTQALWSALMPENPSRFKDPNRPVEQVSWFDAVKFCNALSKNHGYEEVYRFKGEKDVVINRQARGFRLPTEAQWEYAARGGTHHINNYEYAGGNDLHRVGWYDRNSHNQTQPVGLKVPNQLGIYDMSGNVWEWCWDWYEEYPKSAQQDPTGPLNGSGRVLRGGGWYINSGYCRVVARRYDAPVSRNYLNGFRVARQF
ncbi:MAG: formylglycine-generating enzyme family protein [Bacteroidia bacterium]